MKKLKKLTIEQKKFLINEGLAPADFLVERATTEGVVFYNIYTETLWDFRK